MGLKTTLTNPNKSLEEKQNEFLKSSPAFEDATESPKMRTSANADMRTSANADMRKPKTMKQSVKIDINTLKKVKKYCLENGLTFQSFVIKLIEEHFRKNKQSTD